MCGPSDTSKTGSGGCTCGCCGCGCGQSNKAGGFTRRFWTDKEKKDCLESYKEQLTKELAALEECTQEGCC